jgi:hypothetical protein
VHWQDSFSCQFQTKQQEGTDMHAGCNLTSSSGIVIIVVVVICGSTRVVIIVVVIGRAASSIVVVIVVVVCCNMQAADFLLSQGSNEHRSNVFQQPLHEEPLTDWDNYLAVR